MRYSHGSTSYVIHSLHSRIFSEGLLQILKIASKHLQMPWGGLGLLTTLVYKYFLSYHLLCVCVCVSSLSLFVIMKMQLSRCPHVVQI
jgi:hypothetical protein